MTDLLKDARRNGIISQISSIRTSCFQHGVLLAPSNMMAKDAVDFLAKPMLTIPPGTVAARTISDMIGEYVAVSTFTHCFDAFEYLGNACNAILQGDPSVAVHLAYYAELRAAMSFLACEGIGVFDDFHCLVDGAGNGFRLQQDRSLKTHRFCWRSYEWLSTTPQAMSLLYCVRIDGSPLIKWLNHFPSAAAINMACSDYLASIGLDIENLSREDQGTRGKASYRPHGIEGASPYSPQDDVDLIRTINHYMCGPNGPRDSSLGVLILCLILRKAFESNNGLDPNNSLPRFKTEVEQMISAMAPSRQTALYLDNYCFSNPLPKIPILTDAVSTTGGDLRGVLARTTLLCFHSQAYTRKLLSECGVSEEDLKFWWRTALENRGAVNIGDDPTSQTVVQDVFDIIGELSVVSGYVDRKSLWEQFANVLTDSCRYERFAVAGFFA